MRSSVGKQSHKLLKVAKQREHVYLRMSTYPSAYSSAATGIDRQLRRRCNANPSPFPTRTKKAKDKLGIALVGLGSYSKGQLAPGLVDAQHCYLAGIVTGTPAKEKIWMERKMAQS